MARMTEAQFRVIEAELLEPMTKGTPASVAPLVFPLATEARRARESEARLVEACKGLLFWGKPGVTFGDPGVARQEAEAAIKAAES